MKSLKTTRDKIVSVARIVFANLSVYKTTMEDIAKASKIGRRTIYSYFGSKEELYSEVVNVEINSILVKLKAVTRTQHAPYIKLNEIFIARMKAVEHLSMKNESLRKDFLNNIDRIENLRKNLDIKETELIGNILKEGIETEDFELKDPDRLAFVLQRSLKALEVPFIKDAFGEWSWETLDVYYKTLLKGIHK
ncbi:TetR/AcrR family transcriptional regulator [Saccharicrinis sp. FJH62]|uniref:TetR/AcrR family transcriptional regulator n=1 Tax=Saccharicrinis sp. FJH62 TaxID=3344657 RepID=UPI0035D41923